MTPGKLGAVALLVPALLATAAAQPRTERPDARSSRVLAAAAASPGPMRVIVRLNAPFALETTLTRDRVTQQRRGFQVARQRLLSRAAARHVRRARPFATIPFMALEVDAAGLAELAAQPEVAGLEFDVPERATLAESTVVTQAAAATAAGYTGAGWNVAILDTGIDRTHPFLAGRVVYEHCYSSTVAAQSTTLCPNGADEQAGAGASAPCLDGGDCDHGTHVAGIAAGSGTPVSGVAPGAGILGFQVYSRFGEDLLSWTSDQVAALDRVYQLRGTYSIAAVNLSLGGGRFLSTADCDAANFNNGRKAIIDQLRAAGIATIVASGNDGYTDALNAPACVSSAISVGSTTDSSSPAISAFSNGAAFLSLLAPGSGIVSSIPNYGFATFSGTSMAAPHVAGAWAVLKAQAPSASVAQVLTALQNTGRPVVDTRVAPQRTQPLIQIYDALSLLTTSCVYSINPATATISSGATQGTIFVTTSPGCPWTATTQSAFITFQNAGSRSGSGELSFSVATNLAGTGRTGTATVAGRRFTLKQEGAPTYPDARMQENARADFDGDGSSDLLWQDTGGSLAVWLLEGENIVARENLAKRMTDPDWRVAGTGDFNGDGKPDIVWQHRTGGWVYLWYMNGRTFLGGTYLSMERMPSAGWNIVGVGDFNGDRRPDLVWQHPTEGWLSAWLIEGTTVTNVPLDPSRLLDAPWHIVGVGDFNADGRSDLLWRHGETGHMGVWLMDGLQRREYVSLEPTVGEQEWRVAAVADLNNDGSPDLVWQNVDHGWVALWYMDGTTRVGTYSFGQTASAGWQIAGPK